MTFARKTGNGTTDRKRLAARGVQFDVRSGEKRRDKETCVPTYDGAGRTFVQDGFDARTGDEREPREQPGASERKASNVGREREKRSERDRATYPPSGERESEGGQTAQA